MDIGTIDQAIPYIVQLIPIIGVVWTLVWRYQKASREQQDATFKQILEFQKETNGHVMEIMNTLAGMSEGLDNVENQQEKIEKRIDRVEEIIGERIERIESAVGDLRSRVSSVETSVSMSNNGRR